MCECLSKEMSRTGLGRTVGDNDKPTCEICANPLRFDESESEDGDEHEKEEVHIARQEGEKECRGTKEQLKKGKTVKSILNRLLISSATASQAYRAKLEA